MCKHKLDGSMKVRGCLGAIMDFSSFLHLFQTCSSSIFNRVVVCTIRDNYKQASNSVI